MVVDPAAWNAKRIKVSGLVTRDFEQFTIAAECGQNTPLIEVWLTYGGRVPTGIIYCCPGEGETVERPAPLTIEGIPLPLVRDQIFERFRKVLARKQPARARAVLVGTLFARVQTNGSGGGYGHMGCCALLAIEQVKEFALQAAAKSRR